MHPEAIRTRARAGADEVLKLLASGKHQTYIWEPVSQLDNALQAAYAARLRGNKHIEGC